MQNKNTGRFMIIGGFGLSVIALFLPHLTMAYLGVEQKMTGMDYNAWMFLVPFIYMLVVSLIAKRLIKILAYILAAIGVVLLYFNISNAAGVDESLTLEIMFGLYAFILGLILQVVGVVLYKNPDKKA